MQNTWFKWQLGIPGIASDQLVIDKRHLRWSKKPLRPTEVTILPEDPANPKT